MFTKGTTMPNSLNFKGTEEGAKVRASIYDSIRSLGGDLTNRLETTINEWPEADLPELQRMLEQLIPVMAAFFGSARTQQGMDLLRLNQPLAIGSSQSPQAITAGSIPPSEAELLVQAIEKAVKGKPDDEQTFLIEAAYSAITGEFRDVKDIRRQLSDLQARLQVLKPLEEVLVKLSSNDRRTRVPAAVEVLNGFVKSTTVPPSEAELQRKLDNANSVALDLTTQLNTLQGKLDTASAEKNTLQGQLDEANTAKAAAEQSLQDNIASGAATFPVDKLKGQFKRGANPLSSKFVFDDSKLDDADRDLLGFPN